MSKQENLTPIRFHLCSMKYTPLADYSKSETHSSILKKVMTHLQRERDNKKGLVLDKNKNRPSEERRELFMTSSVYIPKDQKIRCSIALLRTGRIPKLKPQDKFKLVPLSELGTPAEETHFFIDYSKKYCVICVEFNNYGPRVSDIEFYLRNIASDVLKLSRKLEVHIYMENTIDKTLKDLKNVLNIDIKIEPNKLKYLDHDVKRNYFSGMNEISSKMKPRFLKIEAMFQSPGNSDVSQELNPDANKMVLELIRRFKSNPNNIDCFDNFVVKYEDKEGSQEIFNLLKQKREFLKHIDLDKIKKKRQFYELIEEEFNSFVKELGSL